MYLPEGVQLTQYHHIRRGDAEAILKHWDVRQAAGATPFYFKNTEDLNAQRRVKRAEAAPINDELRGRTSAPQPPPPEGASETQPPVQENAPGSQVSI